MRPAATDTTPAVRSVGRLQFTQMTKYQTLSRRQNNIYDSFLMYGLHVLHYLDCLTFSLPLFLAH